MSFFLQKCFHSLHNWKRFTRESKAHNFKKDNVDCVWERQRNNVNNWNKFFINSIEMLKECVVFKFKFLSQSFIVLERIGFLFLKMFQLNVCLKKFSKERHLSCSSLNLKWRPQIGKLWMQVKIVFYSIFKSQILHRMEYMN